MRRAKDTTAEKTGTWELEPELEPELAPGADTFEFVGAPPPPDPLAGSDWNVIMVDVINETHPDAQPRADDPEVPVDFAEADLFLF